MAMQTRLSAHRCGSQCGEPGVSFASAQVGAGRIVLRRRASLDVSASRTLAWGGEARGPLATPAEPVWTEIGLIVRDDNLPRRGRCIEPLPVLCREPDVHCPQTVLALCGPMIGLVTHGCSATLASAP
jgi:hypothetical protein